MHPHSQGFSVAILFPSDSLYNWYIILQDNTNVLQIWSMLASCQELLKTESLDDAILEHYTVLSKYGNCMCLLKTKNKLKNGCLSK